MRHFLVIEKDKSGYERVVSRHQKHSSAKKWMKDYREKLESTLSDLPWKNEMPYLFIKEESDGNS